MVRAGAEVFGRHAEALGGLLRKAGRAGDGTPNAFWGGIQTGSRQTIGAAQIAAHRFIAACGTLASDARHLGLDGDARRRKGMTDEMNAADERTTRLAEREVDARAGAGA